MSRRPWLGLGLSLALHLGVVTLALVVLWRDDLLPALIVDLRESFIPGAASVRSPAEQPPTASARAPRSRRAKSEVASPTLGPSVSPPSAPLTVAPAPPPVAEAPPAPAVAPPAPPSQPPRESSPIASSSTRELAEPKATASPAGPPTNDAPARAGGGPNVGGNGMASASSAGGEPGSTGRGESRAPAGPAVASVPPGGGGSGVGAEYGPYLAAFRQRIQQALRYPASARRRGVAGTVNVEVLILLDGAIGSVTLLESSSHTVLDEAALDTIRSLPRMPLPRELPARELRVRVPVVFELAGR